MPRKKDIILIAVAVVNLTYAAGLLIAFTGVTTRVAALEARPAQVIVQVPAVPARRRQPRDPLGAVMKPNRAVSFDMD